MILGLVVDPREPTSTTPAEIAATGAQLARVVLRADHDLAPFIQECTALDVGVLPVITGESFAVDWAQLTGQDLEDWAQALAALWRNLTPWGIEVGNEPDLDSPSSWTMDVEDLNVLLRAVRRAFPRVPIVAAGLASGDPDWARGLDRGAFDMLSIHPYGRRPRELLLPAEYAEIEDLLAGYAELGKPIVVSEFGAPQRDFDDQADRAIYYAALAEYFARNGIAAACAFCLAGDGVEEFALKGTMAASTFRAVAAQVKKPVDGGRMFPGQRAPDDVKQLFADKVPQLYPGSGDAWPIKEGPYAGEHIIPGWLDGIWVGVYTYATVINYWGEVWSHGTLNQPAAVAAGLNNKPF